MDSVKMSTFVGFSSILTVFCGISIVMFYLLSRWKVTGLIAFGVVYLVWIVVIGILTFTGGDE